MDKEAKVPERDLVKELGRMIAPHTMMYMASLEYARRHRLMAALAMRELMRRLEAEGTTHDWVEMRLNVILEAMCNGDTKLAEQIDGDYKAYEKAVEADLNQRDAVGPEDIAKLLKGAEHGEDKEQ